MGSVLHVSVGVHYLDGSELWLQPASSLLQNSFVFLIKIPTRSLALFQNLQDQTAKSLYRVQ